MNPKEKAMELVNKFWHAEPLESQEGMEIQMAIKCALISVDEIINISLPSSEYGGVITNNTIEYWQEVKQEIEKL